MSGLGEGGSEKAHLPRQGFPGQVPYPRWRQTALNGLAIALLHGASFWTIASPPFQGNRLVLPPSPPQSSTRFFPLLPWPVYPGAHISNPLNTGLASSQPRALQLLEGMEEDRQGPWLQVSICTLFTQSCHLHQSVCGQATPGPTDYPAEDAVPRSPGSHRAGLF